MEQNLARLEEMWMQVQWQFEDSSRGLQTVHMAQDDFEVLENDQLVVQSMLSSRFVATFDVKVANISYHLQRVSQALAADQRVARAAVCCR